MKTSKDNNSFNDLAARKLADGILYVQGMVAEKLQAMEMRLTVRQKWVFLAWFCLVGVGTMVFLLVNALQGTTPVIQPGDIHSPALPFEYYHKHHSEHYPDSLLIDNQ